MALASELERVLVRLVLLSSWVPAALLLLSSAISLAYLGFSIPLCFSDLGINSPVLVVSDIPRHCGQ
jgi:hypothetical protein